MSVSVPQERIPLESVVMRAQEVRLAKGTWLVTSSPPELVRLDAAWRMAPETVSVAKMFDPEMVPMTSSLVERLVVVPIPTEVPSSKIVESARVSASENLTM